MTRWLLAGAVVLSLPLLMAGPAFAQVGGPQDPCRNLLANVEGIAKADIVVSTTAVRIFAASPTRIMALVENTSDTDAARCMTSNDGTPTATAGFKFPKGATLSFTLEGQRELKCIRDTSATANLAMSVWECTP
jgi:hypothetical protein